MDKELTKRQKDMYYALWIGTVLAIIVIGGIWIFNRSPESLNDNTWITVYCVIILALAWIFFHRQKRIDENKISEKRSKFVEGLFSGTNISHGIYWKYKSIGAAIGAVVFLSAGIYILVTDKEFWWIGLILIGISILSAIAVKLQWEVGKRKMKGRYY